MKKIITAYLIIVGLIFITSCKNPQETAAIQERENDTAINDTRVEPEPSESIYAVRSADTVLVFYDSSDVYFDEYHAVRYEHFLPEHQYASQYNGRLVFPKILFYEGPPPEVDWYGQHGLSYYIGRDEHVSLVKHESGEFNCDQARFNKICTEADERWERWNNRLNTLGMKQAIERESTQPFKVYFNNYYFDPPDMD